MKRPEELLEKFRREREQMTPEQRVEAYREFNLAMAASLAESSRWETKAKRDRR